MKKLLLIILFFFFFWPLTVGALNEVNLYFFWGIGCPHCKHEQDALIKLAEDYDNLKIYDYEVNYNLQNSQLLKEIANLLDKEVRGIPFTVIGREVFEGFNDYQLHSIERTIEYYSNHDYDDIVGKKLGIINQDNQNQKDNNEILNNEEDNNNEVLNNDNYLNQKDDKKITLPIIGDIFLKNYSLPVITIIIGLIDGFNPCAMWVLLFLISMLITMKNHKRRWILGLAFLITSAFIYFLFMLAWLNLTHFISSIFIIRLLIALIAVGGGLVNLKLAYQQPKEGCQVINETKRNKIFNQIKNFTKEQQFSLALIGIIGLAISINFIELMCSAGLPLAYIQVLALNDLSSFSYLAYILLYIFFFLLDDLIVFTIAMTTLNLTGISSKYSKLSHLIGGILMIIIGLLLILKPNWLSFGTMILIK